MRLISSVPVMASLIIGFTLSFALNGCGGGRPSPSTPSPFAGSFQGTFNRPFLSQNGTVNLSIEQDGSITGTSFNFTAGSNIILSGSVDESGNIQLSVQGADGSYDDIGIVTLDSSGNLTGGLTETHQGDNAFIGPITYSLVKE